MSNGRKALLIAGVAVLATVVLVSGVIVGLRLGKDRTPAPRPQLRWTLNLPSSKPGSP
jgi:hypothetical protein